MKAFGYGFGFVFGGNIIQKIISAFKSRVLADSGTFESESCLNTEIARLRNLGLYDKASLILTPNAYKTSKIYSLVPGNGIGDFTFSRAGFKRVRNSAGRWISISSNVPPLHYPIGGGCPSWLNEPTATSPILHSADLTNAAWTKSGATVQSTTIPSPIEGINWSRVNVVNGGGIDRVFQAITVASGAIRTLSVYVKPDSYTGSIILRGDASGNSANVTLNLTTKALTNSGANVISSRIIDEVDGAIRLVLIFTTVLNPVIDIITSSPGVSGVSYLATQIQFENLAFPTSPIVTTSASATRLLDATSRTGISSLIGQASGVLFAELMLLSSGACDLWTINQSVSNSVNFVVVSGGTLRAYIYYGGSTIIINGPTIVANTVYKIAIRYQSGSSAFFVNGVRYSSGTAFSFTGSLSTLQATDTYFSAQTGHETRCVALFPTPLTDAELIALTTL